MVKHRQRSSIESSGFPAFRYCAAFGRKACFSANLSRFESTKDIVLSSHSNQTYAGMALLRAQVLEPIAIN
jgi:hypothetical protein